MLKESVIFGIVKDGQIVVQHRLNPNKSYFNLKIIPGGKMEEGESIEESVVREVLEETGLGVNEIKYLDSLQTETEKGNQYLHHIVLVTEFTGEIDENKEPDARLFFIPLSESKSICEHPFSHKVIDLIEKALKVG